MVGCVRACVRTCVPVPVLHTTMYVVVDDEGAAYLEKRPETAQSTTTTTTRKNGAEWGRQARQVDLNEGSAPVGLLSWWGGGIHTPLAGMDACLDA